jgi:hypothetical protein
VDRPDFSFEPGERRRILWTEERVAWVRHLAGLGKSALEIAEDVGLRRGEHDRIRSICSKEGIRLIALGGRPKLPVNNETRINIPVAHLPMLRKLAVSRGVTHLQLTRRLVRALLEQGETLLENLLDDQEEGMVG